MNRGARATGLRGRHRAPATRRDLNRVMPAEGALTDQLQIADRAFDSRLLIGTGKFGSHELMRTALEASGAQIVTVALRRVDLDSTGGPDILEFIDTDRVL